MTGIGNCPECDAEIGMKANRCRYCGALTGSQKRKALEGEMLEGAWGNKKLSIPVALVGAGLSFAIAHGKGVDVIWASAIAAFAGYVSFMYYFFIIVFCIIGAVLAAVWYFTGTGPWAP